jgi:hypothetical protein
MKKGSMVTPRRTTLLVTTFATCVTVALALSSSPEAESASPTPPAPVSTTQSLAGSISSAISEALTGTEPSSTEIPLTNSFQPATPWPMPTTVSQTILQAPHNLLAYSGVDSVARQMLGLDFSQWRSQLGENPETNILPGNLLLSSGCLNPCESQKSMLVVNSATHRIYAAMVSNGKLSMWPSLMSWPDEAIPSLKSWLAEAAE